MTIEAWWIWLGVAAIFVVGEMLTAGFFLLWFGIAAGLAALLAGLDVGPAGQWGGFLVSAVALVAISRPFADRMTKKQPAGVGADRFVGQAGVVLEAIDAAANTGRVRVGPDEWRANSHDSQPIAISTKIKVVRVDGTHLVVKPKEA